MNKLQMLSVWLVKKIWLLVAIVIIAAACMLSVGRAITPLLNRFQADIEQWVSAAIHVPVTIGELQATWHGLEPTIKLSDVEFLQSPGGPVIANIQQLYLGIDLIDSIRSWSLQPGRIMLEGVDLNVIQTAQGEFRIEGMTIPLTTDTSDQTPFRDQVIGWLFSQRNLHLRQLNIHVARQQKPPITLADISVQLQNRGEQHRLSGEVAVKADVVAHLKFFMNIHGNLLTREALRGKFHFSASNVQILQEFWPQDVLGLAVQSERIDVDFSGRLQDSQLTQLDSRLLVESLHLRSLFDDSTLAVDYLATRVNWKQQVLGGWLFNIDKLMLVIDGVAWPEDKLRLEKTVDEASQRDVYALSSHYVRLQNAVPFVVNHFIQYLEHATPVTESAGQLDRLIETANILHTVAPRGELSELHATWHMQADRLTGYSAGAQFDHISLHLNDTITRVSNLSGNVILSESSGKLALNSQNSQFDFAELFRQPLLLNTLQGELDWHRQAQGWQIAMPKLRASVAKANAVASMVLDVPDAAAASHDPATIELLASVQAKQLEKADFYRYLPVSIIPEPVVTWLDQALQQADDVDATLVLRGPLAAFPYANNEGTFLVDSQVKQASLDYFPDWPPAENLSGRLVFFGRAMHAQMHSGSIAGMPIQQLQADIPLMSQVDATLLEIKGHAKGDMAQAFNVIQSSPLQATVGQELARMRATGPMAMDLQLTIPLSMPADPTLPEPTIQVLGQVDLQDIQLSFPSWDISLDQLRGPFTFTETGLAAKQLQANLLGYPAQLTLQTLTDEHDKAYTQAQLHGTLAVAEIEQAFALSLQPWIQGKTPFNVTLNLRDGGQDDIQLTTELRGISSQLPNLLAKSAAVAVPTKLSLSVDEKENLTLWADYGDTLSGVMRLQPTNHGLSLERGAVHLGPGKVTLPKQTGLWVEGSLAEVVWPEPTALRSNSASTSTSGQLGSVIEHLAGGQLHINRLALYNYEFHDVDVQAERGVNDWQLQLTGDKLAGSIRLPRNGRQQPIQINFQQLQLAPLAVAEDQSVSSTEATTFSLTDMPALEFTCQQCFYHENALGRVTLNLFPQSNGIKVDPLRIDNSVFDLFLRGEVIAGKNGEETLIQGTVNSNDVAKALTTWGLPANLESQKAKASFQLQWPGSPLEFSSETLVGDVKILLNGGRIVGLSKETDAKLGMGRLLTLLSLQSLPKRMQLDFSDLTHKGYYFDKLKGQFRFADGKATTANTELNGTVARVLLQGEINLVQRQYDLMLSVMPHVTSSLPLVATIAGGPVAGVVTWAVDKAISPEVKRITRYDYTVTGSWDDPKIEPVRKEPSHIAPVIEATPAVNGVGH